MRKYKGTEVLVVTEFNNDDPISEDEVVCMVTTSMRKAVKRSMDNLKGLLEWRYETTVVYHKPGVVSVNAEQKDDEWGEKTTGYLINKTLVEH